MLIICSEVFFVEFIVIIDFIFFNICLIYFFRLFDCMLMSDLVVVRC